MAIFNPNTATPTPRVIEISKIALDFEEYAEMRVQYEAEGKTIKDLNIDPEEAELKPEEMKDLGGEIPDWYTAVAPKKKTGPKKKHPEIKLNDFVDSSKFIKGSSDDDNYDSEGKKKRKGKRRGRKPVIKDGEEPDEE